MPLLAVADLAGSDWPKLAREAAVALIAAGRETPKSLNLWLLSDLRTIFENNKEVVRKAIPEGLPTKAILAALGRAMERFEGQAVGRQRAGRSIAPL